MFGTRTGSFQVARIFGIRIGVSVSWFLVLFFYILTLSPYFHNVIGGSRTTAYLLAVVSALAFFGSIVLHELGHALVARREGLVIDGIDLWFLGGFARMRGQPETPGAELRVAAAGPLVTLVIVAIGIGLGEALQHGHFFAVATAQEGFTVSPGIVLLSWLTSINVLVLAFNLVPALPLDGGRIARAIVWWRTGDQARGTRAAGLLGRGFAILLAGYGLYLVTRGDNWGLWLMLVALFIYQSASAALASSTMTKRITGVTVADIMDPAPVTLPSDTTLLDAQERYFQHYHWPWFAVVDPVGHFLGLARAERVAAEIEAGRPALRVADVIDPADMIARVEQDVPIETLLRSEGLRRLGAAFAVDREGVLRGVVTLAHIQRAMATSSHRAG
jgi:Zn-dependent protease